MEARESMKSTYRVILSATALAVALSLGACGKSGDDKGPAEKAGATMGKAIDKATEQAGQAMEKAGEALKDAGEKAAEMAKDAADKVRDTKK
jgi:hypothetical protein